MFHTKVVSYINAIWHDIATINREKGWKQTYTATAETAPTTRLQRLVRYSPDRSVYFVSWHLSNVCRTKSTNGQTGGHCGDNFVSLGPGRSILRLSWRLRRSNIWMCSKVRILIYLIVRLVTLIDWQLWVLVVHFFAKNISFANDYQLIILNACRIFYTCP